jgi:hypothetical protein
MGCILIGLTWILHGQGGFMMAAVRVCDDGRGDGHEGWQHGQDYR